MVRKFSTTRSVKKTEAEIEAERIEALKDYSPPTMRVFKLGRPAWWILPFAFLGCLVGGSVMPLEMWALSKAISVMYIPLMPGGSVEAMKEELDTWILVFILTAFGSFIGDSLKFSCFTYFQETDVLKLRELAFNALLRQDVGFFDDPNNGPAGLTTALARQTTQVSHLVGVSVGNIIGSVVSLLTGCALAFVLGTWELTLALLALVPILGASMAVLMTVMMGGGGSNKAYSVAGEISSEAILNIRTVRALLLEEQSLTLFSDQVWSIATKQAKGAWKNGVAFGLGNAVILGFFTAGFACGAWLIDEGRTDMEAVMVSMMCVMGGAMGAGMSMGFAPDANKAKLAAHDVFRLIDRESKVDAMNPDGKHRTLGDGSIEFEDVRFTYPHRLELPILRGLSWKVAKGQSVAFVGPSGSGKSTIIQMLQRFYDPTQGSVKVGGTDLRHFDISYWRQQVGFVGQEPILFEMSLEDNVKYGKPDATRDEVEVAAKMANMDYVFNGKVAWTDSVGAKGGKLSGGQKQRCAIARALVRQPSVLLLDEATSALDSVSERVVQEALDVAKMGRTTFTIAHRLSTIQDCDVIIVIVSGEVVEQGNHEELMERKGVYANLVSKGQH